MSVEKKKKHTSTKNMKKPRKNFSIRDVEHFMKDLTLDERDVGTKPVKPDRKKLLFAPATADKTNLKPKDEKPSSSKLKEQAKQPEKHKSLEIKPNKMAENPKSLEINPTKMAEKPKSLEINPTKMAEDPTSLEIKPTKMAEDPTSLEIKPTKMAEDPTSLEIKPTKMAEDPKSLEMKPTTSKMQDPNAESKSVNPLDLLNNTEKERLAKELDEMQSELLLKNNKMQIELDELRRARKVLKIHRITEQAMDAVYDDKTIVPFNDEFPIPEIGQPDWFTATYQRPRSPLANAFVTEEAVDIPGLRYKEHKKKMREFLKNEKKTMRQEARLLRDTTGMFKKVTFDEKQKIQTEQTEDKKEPQPHHSSQNPPDTAVNKDIRLKNQKTDNKCIRKQREKIAKKERRKQEKIDIKKMLNLYKLRKAKAQKYQKESQALRVQIAKEAKEISFPR